ncbi:NlpC/P60 family protein [Streptomyces aurantiacus]
MGGVAAHVSGTSAAAAAQQAQSAACAPGTQAGADVDATQVARQVNDVLAHSPSDIKVSGLPAPKEQIPAAKVIVATGAELGVPARGQVIALATALQESGLRNISHGDRDSVGLFQQRPSMGWGSRQQIMDPVYASTRFYRALKSVKGWERMPVTAAAQKVQKSGTPDAYAKHEPLATALQRAIAPRLGTAPAQPLGPGSGTAGALAGCGAGPDGSQYGTIEAGKLPKGYRIPANANPKARIAIQWALKQLGGHYQWGGSCTKPLGTSPTERCDCSSLMQRAYGIAGIQLGRTTYAQVTEGRPGSATAPQPGDLLFSGGSTSSPRHVAMAIGDGLLVHAPRPGRVIEVGKITDQGKVLAVRRVA